MPTPSFRAQGIRGTRAEVEAACAVYGDHPLSLRLLAGLIVSDLQQPGDIAAARRLDVSGDLVQRQHHVLERAFDNLTPAGQMLLGRIACFRSPVPHDTLKALMETQANAKPQRWAWGWWRRGPSSSRTGAQASDLDADLRDLVARGLLHHDVREGRFDLHPNVRRYAYDRLAALDRVATHIRLRDYFAAVPKKDTITRLEDLASVIELYHHLARLRADQGSADEAQRLADEARIIAERCGNVLQGADAHLELARLALVRHDRHAARLHAEEAHRLATCDGPPDYTYDAAYTEASALLVSLAP